MTERRKELDIEPALVPQVWEDAIAACLTKDPSRRPQSVAEVAQRLQLVPGQTRTRRAPGRSSNRKALLVGGIAALSLLVLAGLYVGVLKRQAKPIPQAAAIQEKSIAVLPFENLSEEKANAYFAEGVQNEILTRLAAVRDLKVISRTSTAKYQSKPDNLKTVAQELGVSTILEGAVQKAGDKVRVNVQLIDAHTDAHLWPKSHDRDFRDVLKVESEVSQEIAEALRANLSPNESHALAAVRTPDTEAYDV